MTEKNINDDQTHLDKNKEFIREQLSELIVLLKNSDCITEDDFQRLHEKARKIK